MSITLEWLISNEQLNNFKCVAGQQYINNVIKSVNILDNPDVVKWIKRDEFVLTTGYIFKDDTALQRSIIRELKDAGCAGLGIKIKRFLNLIPPEMIDEANLVGLPLIEMPFYYSFSDILNLIYDEINLRKLSDLEVQNNFIDKLTLLFIENKGIDRMIGELAIFIKKPVLLLDIENRLISAGVSQQYEEFLHQKGSIVITQSGISPISYFDTDKRASNMYKYVSINGGSYRFFVMTIPNYMGSIYILLEEAEPTIRYQGIIEKSLHIISVELSRSMSGKMSTHHNHQDFFLDFLMSNEQRSDNEIINLCDFFGFDCRSKRVCITMAFNDCQSEYLKKKIADELCLSIKEDICKDKKVYICSSRELLSVYVFFNRNTSSIEAVAQAHEIALSLYALVKSRLFYQMKIGVSRCHEGISSVRTAFKDCMEAFSCSLTIKNDIHIHSYATQSAYHILKKLSPEEINKIYRDTVEPLVSYDCQNDSELFLTFQTYYNNRLNASETAKKMFLHRNTLMNRLDKIKELINFEPEEYGMTYSYYLGICAYEIIKNEKQDP